MQIKLIVDVVVVVVVVVDVGVKIVVVISLPRDNVPSTAGGNSVSTGILPYIRHIGMCRSKAYRFCAVLV